MTWPKKDNDEDKGKDKDNDKDNTFREHLKERSQRLVTFETSDHSDEET